MSGVTGIVAAHWYWALATTVIAVLVAGRVFAVHDPTGPHVTLPVVVDRSVAQLIVTDDWIESVRYGYRVSAGLGAAPAELVRTGSRTAMSSSAAAATPRTRAADPAGRRRRFVI